MNGKRIRMLFAEDDNAVRMITSKLFQTRGYEVVEAVNGEDAIEKFKTDSEVFDVIVTDFKMPIMDGFVFSQEVKQIHGDIPVVLYSGYGTRRNLSENGIDHSIFSAVLGKPTKVETLHEVIKFVLQGGYTL